MQKHTLESTKTYPCGKLHILLISSRLIRWTFVTETCALATRSSTVYGLSCGTGKIQDVFENTDIYFFLYLSCLLTYTHRHGLQTMSHHWKFTSIANDHYLTTFPEPRAGARKVTTTSGQTEFGPTAHCFQNSAALLGRHHLHPRTDHSRQLGDVSGFTLVSSFLDMAPEVEVRRREVRRPL